MPLVAVHLHVEVMQVPHELRVDALHVVGLIESVHGRLPVAVPLDGHVLHERHLVDVVRLQMLAHWVEELFERFCFRVQTEEDEAVPGGARQFAQPAAVRCALRVGVEVGNTLEAAVDFVFPVVVLALERVGARVSFWTQAVAAVETHVVERAHAAILLAHDEHRLFANFRTDVVAGFLQVLQETAEQPHLRPHVVPFALHELARGIAFLRDEHRRDTGVRRFGVHGALLARDARHFLVGRRARSRSECLTVQRNVRRDDAHEVLSWVPGQRSTGASSGRPAAQRKLRRNRRWKAGTFQLPRSSCG